MKKIIKEAVRELNFGNTLTDNIIHNILSHHGFNPAWSKNAPETLEATLLHHADMLSAYFGPTSKLK